MTQTEKALRTVWYSITIGIKEVRKSLEIVPAGTVDHARQVSRLWSKIAQLKQCEKEMTKRGIKA
jgi:hypothetical protein